MSARPRRLVVVGAGIAGLTAAFEWRRRRPDDEIVVLEAGGRIGGKLDRIELDEQPLVRLQLDRVRVVRRLGRIGRRP